jgi:DMSO/TMAO reductase YedYZ molybdopterin-dependent catalytic subunit
MNLMALFGADGNRKELEKLANEQGRLPPGQSLTLKWPVLHCGNVPYFDEARWDFTITGEVAAPVKLSWKRVSRAAANGNNFRFSLRDALESLG